MLLRARQQVTLQGVALFHGESCTAAGTLLNLAPSGCAIQSERCPSVGDYVNVALLIPDSDPVLADVARSDGSRKVGSVWNFYASNRAIR